MTTEERTRLASIALKVMYPLQPDYVHSPYCKSLRECVRLAECWDRLKNLGTTTLSEGILWSHLLLKVNYCQLKQAACN